MFNEVYLLLVRDSVPIYNYPETASDDQILTTALTQAMFSYLKEITSVFFKQDRSALESGVATDFQIIMSKYHHLFPFMISLNSCVEYTEDGKKVYVEKDEEIRVYGYAMLITITDDCENIKELRQTMAELKTKIKNVLSETMPCDPFDALSEHGSELRQKLDAIIGGMVARNRNALIRLAKKYKHYIVQTSR